jgi:hypothetical protein
MKVLPHTGKGRELISKAGKFLERPAAPLSVLGCEPAKSARFSRVDATYTPESEFSAGSPRGIRIATSGDATYVVEKVADSAESALLQRDLAKSASLQRDFAESASSQTYGIRIIAT